MKRILCLLTAVLVLGTLAAAVFAADNEFVPSISYKDSPDIVPTKDPDGKTAIGTIIDNKADGKQIGYLYDGCLLVTPVADAQKSTSIPANAKEQLIMVYNSLRDGFMMIPYELLDPELKGEEMVVRDLFDISFLCLDHPELVKQEGVVVKITFDLNLPADAQVYPMVYSNGKWTPAVSNKNNGDGTVTCAFENVGAVVFAVRQDAPPSQTGDMVGGNLPLWIAVMSLSALALIVLLVLGSRKKNS